MIVFYNKPLLRTLVALIGVTLAYVGYSYTAGMAAVLGRQGMLDALAILGYLAAAFIVLIVAEVADSHYVRAFGGLSLAGGLATAWRFLSGDLAKLPEGSGQPVTIAFWIAALLGLCYLLIIVIRLVLDKLNLGRPVISEASRISQFEGAMEHPAYRERAAEPKTDKSVWDDPAMLPDSGISAASASVTAEPQAQSKAVEVKPVTRLVGIGGAHSGLVFELAPGEFTLGRSETCDICLAGDNQVSRAHARITVDDANMGAITDLGSTNGLLINGSRVSSVPLAPGMCFTIGTTTFKVE